MKTFITTLICLLFIQFAKAQSPSVEWIYKFKVENIHSWADTTKTGLYRHSVPLNGNRILTLGDKEFASMEYGKFSPSTGDSYNRGVALLDSNGLDLLITASLKGINYSFQKQSGDTTYSFNECSINSILLDNDTSILAAVEFYPIILKLGPTYPFTRLPVAFGLLKIDLFNTGPNYSTGIIKSAKILDFYGGSKPSIPFTIKKTRDNNFLLAGFTNSTNLSTPNHGQEDVLLIKLDRMGNILWSKTYGGSGRDTAFSIAVLTDGYVIAGVSTSNNGDLQANKGQKDGWVFKIDLNGNLQWQKNFGGSANDLFNQVIWDSLNNKLVLSGHTLSTDGDINGNHGQKDFWVVQIDMTGNLLWSKTFGGSSDDISQVLKQDALGNYLIAGCTRSADGDISDFKGGLDGWLVNVNSNGQLLWTKCIGSAKKDEGLYDLIPLPNGIVAQGSHKYFNNYSSSLLHLMITKLSAKNSLSGQTFFDANNNGIKDASEEPFDYININAQKQGSNKTGFVYDGWYEMALDTGSYTVKAQPYSPYFHVVPDSVSISHSSFYFSDTVHFAIQAIPGIKDASVTLLPLTPVRPGFNVQHKLIAANVGTEALTNVPVRLVNDARLSYVSASPTPDSVKADTIYWHISLLAPQDTVNILINTKAAVPPTLANGNSLQSIAQILQSADADSSNNHFILNQIATGSYDPNDKKNTLGKQVIKEELAANGWINYLVRFQNTGTDTAFSVVLRDTLPANLDMASLQMVDASHAYQMEANGRALVWRFENILLPDSNHNKTASNGFVAYRVKASKPAEGDTIKNKAAIYFDFNLPVITNTDLLAIAAAPGTICPSGTAVFNAGNAGAVSYQWQLDYGEGFSDIANSANYSGTQSAQLSISNTPSGWYGYQYRCRMVLPGGQVVYSSIVTLTFVNQWKGTIDNNWHNTSNWSCGQIPDAFTDVIIPAGVPFSPVINQPGATCRSARLLTGANLKLAAGNTLAIMQ